MKVATALISLGLVARIGTSGADSLQQISGEIVIQLPGKATTWERSLQASCFSNITTQVGLADAITALDNNGGGVLTLCPNSTVVVRAEMMVPNLFNSVIVKCATSRTCTIASSGTNHRFLTLANGNFALEGMVVKDFTLSANNSKGAVFNTNGTVSLVDCFFQNNINALSGGGVVYAGTGSSVNILQCDFFGNAAFDFGGAVNTYKAASINVTDCTFTENDSGMDGGAIRTEASKLYVTKSVFTNNTSFQGGAITVSLNSTLVVRTSKFTGNMVRGNGGALSIGKQSSLQVRIGCKFIRNEAKKAGGAIYVALGGTLRSVDPGTYFLNNKAGTYCNDIYNRTNTSCVSTNATTQSPLTIPSIRPSSPPSLSPSQQPSPVSTCLKIASQDDLLSAIQSVDSIGGGVVAICRNTTIVINSEISLALQNPVSVKCEASRTCTLLSSNSGNFRLLRMSKGNLKIDGVVVKNFRLATGETGGVFNVNGTFSLVDSLFQNNTNAFSDGGVLFAGNLSTVNIMRCTFAGNSAQDLGGAVYVYGATIRVSDSQFTENDSSVDSGAIHLVGSNLNLNSSVFTNNASDQGGCIKVYIGSYMLVTNSEFNGNHVTKNGGAVAIGKQGVADVGPGCRFDGNAALRNGGAVHVASGGTLQSLAASTIFIGNTAFNCDNVFNRSSTACLP